MGGWGDLLRGKKGRSALKVDGKRVSVEARRDTKVVKGSNARYQGQAGEISFELNGKERGRKEGLI